MINDKIIAANKLVHSSLVLAGNYETSPHFLPENKLRVRNKLTMGVIPLLNTDKIKAIDFGLWHWIYD